MWWLWHNFLYTTDKTVSSDFYPSPACIFILQIYRDTASRTILTSTVYFVIFPQSHILNFRQPHHGIRISIENIHTQALFWIFSLPLLFPGLFFHQSCPVHYFLPFTVLFSLSLVETKEQITIIYVEELGGGGAVQNFSFAIIWHQNMYPHIPVTENIVVFDNTPTQSHDI